MHWSLALWLVLSSLGLGVESRLGTAKRQVDDNGTVPDTGVTHSYNFTLARSTQAPDGVSKSVILVNGAFPGPTIEANWGDMIKVSVYNNIQNPGEGTAIHWHGIPMVKTPWHDGVPSVQQCPIAPGETFVYRFQAEAFGTSWWHAHYSAQYIDGAFGPMIIHGPEESQYDIDLGPILLTDYTHTEYFSYLLSVYKIPPEFLPADNNLINGLNPFDCSLVTNGTPCDSSSATVPSFQFQSGQTHLLRLINAGGLTNQKFSIDGYNLTVVSNDFTPIQPYTTQVVTLGVGQRSDILVQAPGQPTDAVWMRSELDIPCAKVSSEQPNARAAIYYEQADTSRLPETQGISWESNACLNDPLQQTKPLTPRAPTVPDVTDTVEITVAANASGNLLFFYDDSSFYADYSDPLLSQLWCDDTSISEHPEWNVHNYGNASAIRLVVYNYFPTMHNMHLHGYTFQVLAEGFGTWDGAITNPDNPQRRDGQQMAPSAPDGTPSYMVIQWVVDNPGVWPFHCHLIVHASAGLYANLVMKPDEIATRDEIPGVTEQTCRGWLDWSATNDPKQIDSGLKHRRDISPLVPRLSSSPVQGQ